MECDEIPQDDLSALPNELEDAKMDVEPAEDASSIGKEESGVDASGSSAVMDESGVSIADEQNVNGKDETDKVEDKTVDSVESENEKTDPQVQDVKLKVGDEIDTANQDEVEGQTGSTMSSKDEIELNPYEAFLIPETITDKEYATSEEMLSNCPWELGQLAWARMSIYPFWPCIVTHEPASMKTFQKVQSKGRSKTLMVHVHFFNDHGRHSWIPSHHMIPFEGIEDFRKRARLITDAIRKKEPKFAAALTIKPNIFATWQKAVAEAMDVLYELDMTPLEYFNIPEKKELALTSLEEPEAKRKRKSKADDDGKEVKKARKSITTRDKNANSKDSNNLNLDTPPDSPMTPGEYRKVYYKKQKQIQKMIDKLQPPDFQVYYERNYDDVIRQCPESTDEHVRMYLVETWNRMKDIDKLKYRSTYIVPRDANQKNLLL